MAGRQEGEKECGRRIEGNEQERVFRNIITRVEQVENLESKHKLSVLNQYSRFSYFIFYFLFFIFSVSTYIHAQLRPYTAKGG